MKQVAFFLVLALSVAPSVLLGQTYSSSSSLVAADASPDGGDGKTFSPTPVASAHAAPFSRLAFGAGISPLGIGLQVATNINEHFNIRGTGNVFKYSTNFTTNGFVSTAALNLASAGVALDVYPFHAGFRLSPGLLLYNGNQLTAASTVAGGTSFTLNHDTYYSSNTDPVTAGGVLGLNANKQAFTMTTGWGNMIPRKNGHLSVPFEIGVAVTGAPALTVNLAGSACLDQAQTQCSPISGNGGIATQIQSSLTAQVAQWNSDLNPLKVYPIFSLGVAYSFHIR